jgi:acetoin utilization deacetylase AcuC-like enzyme
LLPEQLLREGLLTDANRLEPDPVTESLILSIHTSEYWHKLHRGTLSAAEVRKTGFPWSAGLVHRERVIAGGTVINVHQALKHGVAFNLAGGTHHAFADRGEGFCLLNDIALGAQFALVQRWARHILVIDLDVHQGNGTAALFAKRPAVFTFSMHGKNNYPLHKEMSDRDVELPDGITDGAYLDILARNLSELLEKTNPDLVFYQAGVDVLATDQLGRLGLTQQGCYQRDLQVFKACKSAAVPVCVSMGGGYSPRLSHILDAHVNTFRAAAEVFA